MCDILRVKKYWTCVLSSMAQAFMNCIFYVSRNFKFKVAFSALIFLSPEVLKNMVCLWQIDLHFYLDMKLSPEAQWGKIDF